MSMSIIGSSPVKVTENGTERELFYNTGSSGAGGLLVVNLIEADNTVRFDKTWQEVANADFAIVLSKNEENDGFISIGWSVINGCEGGDGNYSVSLDTGDIYATDSEDGYPTIT